MKFEEVVLFISKEGNIVLNDHGNYRCHFCGTPDDLIFGTLNKANRLKTWCAHCTFVDKDDTSVLVLPIGLHVPKFVLDSVKDVVKNCERITSSCSAAQIHSFMLKIECEWHKQRGFYKIKRGCKEGCSGCAYVSGMISLWATEVPKGQMWYGDFSNMTCDITRAINPQLAEEEKAEPRRWRSSEQATEDGCVEDYSESNETVDNRSDEEVNDDSDSDKTIPLPQDVHNRNDDEVNDDSDGEINN